MKVELMSKIFIPFICAIFFVSAIHAQDKCDNTYSEPSIGVTFCAPQTWSIIKKLGEPYADVFGETRRGETPNINIRLASFNRPLSEYADGAVEYLVRTKAEGAFSKVEMKSKSEFAADKKGFKVVYNTEAGGTKLRTIQYYFKGKESTSIIIITATLPVSDADAIEKVVDASIKTFKITAVKPVRIGTRKISSGL